MSVPRYHCFEDARRQAERRLPSMVFDYIDGAAGTGEGEAENRALLQSIKLRTRVLRNVSSRSLAGQVFGSPTGLPFGIAPMGFGNMAMPGADLMLARMAARHNIPVGVSTAATTSLEEMAVASEGHAWFQLYYTADNTVAEGLLKRAEAAGYQTLVFTVDVPEIGRRPRELRQNFRLPFTMNARQFVDCALHPRWSLSQAYNALKNGAPRLANFGNGFPEFDRKASRAGADFDYLARLRKRWKGRLVVKGVLDVEDALKLKSAGVDAIQVSSHGGRQLDSAPLPILSLRQIRASVGDDMALFYDSGIRCGEDMIKAYAAGADFVFAGRPFLYAIAGAGAGRGEAGLEALIEMLTAELQVTLAQLGETSVSAINSGHILFPHAV